MSRTVAHVTQAPQDTRWTKIMYDASSVDHDIEAIIDLLRQRHGYTRKKARNELLFRLAAAAR